MEIEPDVLYANALPLRYLGNIKMNKIYFIFQNVYTVPQTNFYFHVYC